MVIDMLKFDIEGSEWGAIMDMIRDGSLQNVKQMAFEVHFPEKPTMTEYELYITTLQELKSLGFMKWKSHHNVFTYYIGKAGAVPKPRFQSWKLMYINKRFM